MGNSAWLEIARLAWNLGKWIAQLALPAEVVRWEWKRFRRHFVYLAAKVVRIVSGWALAFPRRSESRFPAPRARACRQGRRDIAVRHGKTCPMAPAWVWVSVRVPAGRPVALH